MDSAITALISALAGAFGVTFLMVVLIAMNPEKVQIWASWIYRGFRLVLKSAEYGAISYDVAGHFNEFFNSQIVKTVEGLTPARLKIKWTNSGAAVAALHEGTVVVRMQPHEHRVANILHASYAAMPAVVAPTLRSDLRYDQGRAIDLQLCRLLAERLGPSGAMVYRNELVGPAIAEFPTIAAILDKLASLDIGGLFVPVMLQELVKLGRESEFEHLPVLAAEVDDFISFLQTIAERQRGDTVDLSFIGNHIRINILLVAHADRRAAGVYPFHRRLGIELSKGVDTVYVMATAPNFGIAEKIVEAFDADRRLLRHPSKKLRIERAGRVTTAMIVPFERNTGYSLHDLFQHAVDERGLVPGARVQGVVTDSQPAYALLDIDGVQGVLRASEVSWEYVADVSEHLGPGEELQVEVLAVAPERSEVMLSRARCIPNPVADLPDLTGLSLAFAPNGRIRSWNNQQALAGTVEIDERVIPALLPQSELEWGADGDLNTSAKLGRMTVVAVRALETIGHLVVSKKRGVGNQWADIRLKYPNGSRLEVTATKVLEEGAYCEIEPGLTGFIPAQEFRAAGYEFADFERTVSEGQVLHVYVRRAVGGQRQRITLGLQRNRR